MIGIKNMLLNDCSKNAKLFCYLTTKQLNSHGAVHTFKVFIAIQKQSSSRSSKLEPNHISTIERKLKLITSIRFQGSIILNSLFHISTSSTKHFNKHKSNTFLI